MQLTCSVVKYTAGEIKREYILSSGCSMKALSPFLNSEMPAPNSVFKDWYTATNNKPGLFYLIPFKSLTFCMNKQQPTKMENFCHGTWLSSFGEKYSKKTANKLNELRQIEHHTTFNHSKRKLSFTAVWPKSYTLPAKTWLKLIEVHCALV